MAWLDTPHELRRAMRVRAKGSIRLHSGNRMIPSRLVDMAVGGICVRAEQPIGLVGLIGGLVRVDLRLDARPAKHFALLGRVLRAHIPTRQVAIAFDAVPDGFEDCVQDELLAAMEHDALPRMILVDTVRARRDHIASAFRSAGCHVTEASTPLEAIAHLTAARFELGLIAIADTVPETVAEELREFLLEEHPGAHMVEIGGSASHRDPAASWLSSTTSRADLLKTRVGRVMTAHGARRQATMSPRSRSSTAR